MKRAPIWRATTWLALPLLWLATALRFWRLDAQSFWNDEGNSARLAERSLRLMVEGAAGDVHPPLYYLLLAAWRQLLGDGEFELRALSAFAGLLLVAGVLGLGRLLARRRGEGLPLIAGLFATLHPALVYYSQEARMYSLLGLWAVLSTLLLWRLLPWLWQQAGRGAPGWAAGYLLVVAAGLYTHYFFPVVLAVHGGLVVLAGLQRRWTMGDRRRAEGNDLKNRFTGVLRWIAVVAAAVALYLPWLPVFLRQTGGREAGGIAAGAFLLEAGRWLVLGETGGEGLSWAVVAGWLLAGLGMVWGHAERRTAGGRPREVALAGLALLPLLAMLVLGSTRLAYLKFLIVAAPFVTLLAARGLWAGWLWAHVGLPTRWVLRAATAALAVLVLWGSAQSLRNLYLNPAFARADYRGIAGRIAAEAHPNAGVILNAANQWEVFTYYHRNGAPVYPIPRGQPDAQRIAGELETIAAQHERLYALFWGEDERDPGRLVERWLDANAFKAREEWVGDVRFVTYAVPPQAAREMELRSDVTFGESITLLGYTLQGTAGLDDGNGREVSAAAGDIVQVTLFWRTTQALDTRYKVFLHLLDGQGPPLAQRDAEPLGNLAPTTTWQPGETIVDNHGLLLPADLAPGRYPLRLGLYPLDDPAARLPLSGGSAAGEDSTLLGVVTVR